MDMIKSAFLLLAIIAITKSALVPAPLNVGATAIAVDTNYDPVPQYTFAYNVQDAITGDSKSQQEVRDGDVVKGSYSVADPDGTIRTVFYTADPVNGFNAIVERGPAVQVRPALAPVTRITG